MSNVESITETGVDAPSEHVRSPLWMVSQEPTLNALVAYLDSMRHEIESHRDREIELVFSLAQLHAARDEFDQMIRRGEESLHRLCELFCGSFLGMYQLQSVAIGEIPSTGERFTLTQIVSREDLYSTIDLDLGTRQLRKLQYFDGKAWIVPTLVANVVEYQPTEPNSHGVHKLISRIKAEEELWNKVVDEIFGLDVIVRQDKQLRHLSPYVKDVFGVKIIVGTVGDLMKLQRSLEDLTWAAGDLAKHALPAGNGCDRLEFVEVKDYLTNHEKHSGWEAIKSVVRWNGKMFEVQLQPLKNFWREREILTKESHTGFKSRREQVRQQVAEQVPLFRFYQGLLKWLFQHPTGPAPVFTGVRIRVKD